MFFSTEIDPHGAPSSMQYFRRATVQYSHTKFAFYTLLYNAVASGFQSCSKECSSIYHTVALDRHKSDPKWHLNRFRQTDKQCNMCSNRPHLCDAVAA